MGSIHHEGAQVRKEIIYICIIFTYEPGIVSAFLRLCCCNGIVTRCIQSYGESSKLALSVKLPVGHY
jgi:hypothetical protein